MTYNTVTDDLIIENSVTDPSGTSHFGELADASDTGGGGGSVAPGNLQSALDTAGANSTQQDYRTVRTQPDETYTNEPYYIPSYVRLHINGSRFEVTTNNNVLRFDTGTFCDGQGVIDTQGAPADRSAHNYVLDATQTDEPFNAVNAGRTHQSTVNLRHRGNQPTAGNMTNPTDGGAVALITEGSTGNNNFITHCWLGQHYVKGYHNGLSVLAESFVNDNFIDLTTVDCNWMGTHNGGDQGKNLIWGHSQGADHVGFLRNVGTSTKSWRFWGHLEDPHRPSGNILVGDGMKLRPTTPINPSSSNQSMNIGTGTTINGIGYEDTAGEPSYNGNEFDPGEMVVTQDGYYIRNLFMGETDGDWTQAIATTGASP